MARTFTNRSERRFRGAPSGEFRCRHCRQYVGVTVSGGRHRNHCPFCLYSRHVDERRPGDRASVCGGSMAPTGVFARRDGELVLIHQCQSCAVERHCRIAADDDLALVQRLPLVTVRQAQRPAATRTA